MDEQADKRRWVSMLEKAWNAIDSVIFHNVSMFVWRWELLSYFVVIVTQTSVILILLDLEEKPLNYLPYGLGSASIIAALSTITRIALAQILVSILAQLKWSWFSKTQRPSTEVQTYSDGTSGGWGSIALIGLMSRNIGDEGAILTTCASLMLIFSLGIATFSQQAVSSSTCWYSNITGATRPVTKIMPNTDFLYISREAGEYSLFYEVTLDRVSDELGAALKQVLAGASAPLQDAISRWQCYGGDVEACNIWGPGSRSGTVGICTQCFDTSALIEQDFSKGQVFMREDPLRSAQPTDEAESPIRLIIGNITDSTGGRTNRSVDVGSINHLALNKFPKWEPVPADPYREDNNGWRKYRTSTRQRQWKGEAKYESQITALAFSGEEKRSNCTPKSHSVDGLGCAYAVTCSLYPCVRWASWSNFSQGLYALDPGEPLKNVAVFHPEGPIIQSAPGEPYHKFADGYTVLTVDDYDCVTDSDFTVSNSSGLIPSNPLHSMRPSVAVSVGDDQVKLPPECLFTMVGVFAESLKSFFEDTLFMHPCTERGIQLPNFCFEEWIFREPQPLKNQWLGVFNDFAYNVSEYFAAFAGIDTEASELRVCKRNDNSPPNLPLFLHVTSTWSLGEKDYTCFASKVYEDFFAPTGAERDCVSIRWFWLAYPLILSIITGILLLEVIVTKYASNPSGEDPDPVWGSSILPLLIYDFSTQGYRCPPCLQKSLVDIEEDARDIQVIMKTSNGSAEDMEAATETRSRLHIPLDDESQLNLLRPSSGRVTTSWEQSTRASVENSILPSLSEPEQYSTTPIEVPEAKENIELQEQPRRRRTFPLGEQEASLQSPPATNLQQPD